MPLGRSAGRWVRPGVVVLAALLPSRSAGQSTRAPTGRELVSFTFGNTPLGEFPSAFKLLSGNLEAVDKDGVRMLKASAITEFLITLPEVLPEDFTLEFSIIPKECCNPEDLAFEGTPTINQGGGSARVGWHRESLMVVGGGSMYQSPMPDELRAALPGVMTYIVASAEGNTLKLYTNGQRVFTLSDRQFVRGRVLRVFLGGQDDGANAVYLARLRISAGAATTVATGPGQSGGGGPPRESQQSGVTGVLNPPGGGDVQPAGTGRAPRTPATQPTATAPTSSGAVTRGPVVTAQSTTRTPPGAPTAASTLAPRTITVPGLTAAGGFTSLAPRTITLSGLTSVGGFANLAPRTITLPGLLAAGGFGSMGPRSITLPGLNAAGSFSSLASRTITLPGLNAAGGFGSMAPRTITLSGLNAAGGFTSLTSRTITLPGLNATGGFTSLAPRAITLSEFTAAGIVPSLAPRSVTLSGFTAAGNFTTLPSRTVTLSGFTAVGITPP